MATATKDAKQAVGGLVRERPAAARRALDDLVEWAGVMSDRLEPRTLDSAISRMHRRLDGMAPGGSGRSLGR